MDLQIYRLLEEDYSTDLFRSEISHMRKNHSDKEFVTIILQYDFINVFWKKEWYFKAFYTLALLDYLSDKHKAPYLEKYNKYRSHKLEKYIYPSSLVMWNQIVPNSDILNKTLKKCKESSYSRYFLKYNIIEPEVEL